MNPSRVPAPQQPDFTFASQIQPVQPQAMQNCPYILPGLSHEPIHSQATSHPAQPCQMTPPCPPQTDPNGIKELREQLEGIRLEMTKVAKGAVEPRQLGFKDFCRNPRANSPFPIEGPKFTTFEGKTDRHAHLVSFCNKCRVIANNDALLIDYFQESLEGDALV